MTKLIVLIVALLSVSLYATSTKRICGKDGQNYNSYEEIDHGQILHMNYCGTGTQQKGQNCAKNVRNDCAEGLNCMFMKSHPCEFAMCGEGKVCVQGACYDENARCDYCKTGQICRGGNCVWECNSSNCSGTCRNNECYDNLGVCVGGGKEEIPVGDGAGNKKKPNCSMGGSSSASFFVFFIFLVGIISFRRKEQR